MDVLVFMIPIALFLGTIGLCAFIWALRVGQYDDIDGAEYRVLMDD
jgi:cbb3-type cytochrome oxidase maturation protein